MITDILVIPTFQLSIALYAFDLIEILTFLNLVITQIFNLYVVLALV